eukprot:1147972-Pelagomonas_calceolata.AAC.3
MFLAALQASYYYQERLHALFHRFPAVHALEPCTMINCPCIAVLYYDQLFKKCLHWSLVLRSTVPALQPYTMISYCLSAVTALKPRTV